MPLVFPPAPTAFFSRAHETPVPPQKKEETSGLRHYRLNIENETKKGRGMPPLPPHKMPPMANMLQPYRANNPAPRPAEQPRAPLPPNNPALSSPEKAAEQFRRMNKSLPDGVRYEPLDEETMRILQKTAAMQKAQPSQQQPQQSQQFFGTQTPMIPQSSTQPAHNTPMIPTPQVTEEIISLPGEAAEILKELAQGERNAHVFYTHFAKISKKESFAVLAKDSKSRMEQYASLILKYFKQEFSPAEMDVDTEIELPEAVALAVSQENKSLLTLANLLELSADTPLENIINRIICKKIVGSQLFISAK